MQDQCNLAALLYGPCTIDTEQFYLAKDILLKLSHFVLAKRTLQIAPWTTAYRLEIFYQLIKFIDIYQNNLSSSFQNRVKKIVIPFVSE